MNINYPIQHVPHATLKKSSLGVRNQSLKQALRAIGGVQTIIPLFAQLDQTLQPTMGNEYVFRHTWSKMVDQDVTMTMSLCFAPL